MYDTLEQQDIDVFSSDEAGTKERPDGVHYRNGVDIGYTAPAKWWNWFWNHITAWLGASKTDRNSLILEMKNVLTSVGISTAASFSHQLSEAVDATGHTVCQEYDDEEITEEIGGVMVTHSKNKPYVVGHTLYIPDTELL